MPTIASMRGKLMHQPHTTQLQPNSIHLANPRH